MRTTAGEASISWGMFGVCSEVCVRASWCCMSEVPCGSEILYTRNLLVPIEAVQCRRSRSLDGSLRSVSDGPEVWCARLVPGYALAYEGATQYGGWHLQLSLENAAEEGSRWNGPSSACRPPVARLSAGAGPFWVILLFLRR